MEHFTLSGIWWLPDTPNYQVAGTVFFEPEESPRLELLGTITPDGALESQLSESGRRFPTIVGVADGSYISLIDCLGTGSRFQVPGIETEDFSARFLLRGSIETDHQQQFTELFLECEYLAEWSGLSRLSYDPEGLTSQPQAGEERVISVKYQNYEETATLPDGARISLHTRYDRSFGERSFTLDSDCYLHIVAPEPLDLDELGRRYVTKCCNFVSLVSDVPSALRNFEVKVGDDRLLEVGSQVVFERKGPTPRRTRQQMMFLPPKVSFGALIVAWFELYERVGRPLNTYFGLLYSPPTFVELQFISSASAAEGIHSRLTKSDPGEKQTMRERKQNILASIVDLLDLADFKWIKALLENAGGPTLKTRLEGLWELAGQSGSRLIPTGSKWADALKYERNNLSHPGRRKLSDMQLFLANLSLVRILSYCLVSELAEKVGAGVPDLASTASDLHLARQIKQLLPEWTVVESGTDSAEN